MQDFLTEWMPPSLTIGGKVPVSPNQLFLYYRDYFQQYSRSLKDYLERVARIVNTATQTQGADLPATADVRITNYQHRITGGGTITNIITMPNLNASHIALVSLDGFSLGTGGNIALAKTTVPGQGVMVLWEPVSQLWYPVA